MPSSYSSVMLRKLLAVYNLITKKIRQASYPADFAIQNKLN